MRRSPERSAEMQQQPRSLQIWHIRDAVEGRCCVSFFSARRMAATYSSVPSGVPRTRTPWGSRGRARVYVLCPSVPRLYAGENDSGIDCELGSMPKLEAVRDNLEAPLIGDERLEVHVRERAQGGGHAWTGRQRWCTRRGGRRANLAARGSCIRAACARQRFHFPPTDPRKRSDLRAARACDECMRVRDSSC